MGLGHRARHMHRWSRQISVPNARPNESSFFSFPLFLFSPPLPCHSRSSPPHFFRSSRSPSRSPSHSLSHSPSQPVSQLFPPQSFSFCELSPACTAGSSHLCPFASLESFWLDG